MERRAYDVQSDGEGAGEGPGVHVQMETDDGETTSRKETQKKEG